MNGWMDEWWAQDSLTGKGKWGVTQVGEGHVGSVTDSKQDLAERTRYHSQDVGIGLGGVAQGRTFS